MRALAAAVISVLVSSAPALADGFRCGTELVSDGASRHEVFQKCGQPSWQETRTVFETVSFYDLTGNWVQRQIARTIDEWIYSRGSTNLDQHLTFSDGRLVEVRPGRYGR